MRCPTRRDTSRQPKPIDQEQVAYNAADNPAGGGLVGRSDYAINCGDQPHNEYGSSNWPGTWGISDMTPTDSFNWCNSKTGRMLRDCGVNELNGISFQRSEIAIKHVTDGTAQTYLIGEKYLNVTHYETGQDPADNETWCTGYNNDNFRNGHHPPAKDRINTQHTMRFGSAHSSVFLMSYCDGHVDGVAYDIDQWVHRGASNRHDGAADHFLFYNPPAVGVR